MNQEVSVTEMPLCELFSW